MKPVLRAETGEWLAFIAQLQCVNPVLAEHLLEWQNRSLADYADFLWLGLRRNGTGNRIIHFASACEAACVQLFGTDFGLAQQLIQSPVVLSAHHTAPIFHPLAFQTLLASISGRNAPRTVPVLSTDWIPMDNLFYPRGLILPGKENLVTVNLFGKNTRKNIVALQAPFGEPEIEKAIRSVSKCARDGTVGEDVAEYYCYLLDEYFRDGFVLAQETYAAQCSVLNVTLCKTLFPDIDFAFVNVSDIAASLLISQFQDESSLLFKLVFYPGFRLELIRSLDGVSGCWDTKKQLGSILFWRVNNKKLEPFNQCYDDMLYAGNFGLKLEPETVVAALRSGTIIPGMCLVLSMLMFSYDVSCIGGMRQIAYGREIRRGVAAVSARFNREESEQISAFPTEGFMAGIYAAMSSAGKPLSLVECLFANEFNRNNLANRSLMRSVLDARRDLLELS